MAAPTNETKKRMPGLLLVLLLTAVFIPLSLQNIFAVEKAVPSAVFEALQEEPFVPVIISLEGKADLEEGTSLASKTQQSSREAVILALKEAAQAAENEIFPFIETEMEKGNIKSYESLWAVNAFAAEINLDGIRRIADLPRVADIKLDRSFSLSYPSAQPARENQAVGENPLEKENLPWNLELINAPKTWNEGFYGDDVIVAIMDTGVDLEHPAVQRQYRGNLSGHDHETSWYDATGENLNDSKPLDQTGHGTHVAGIILGGTPEDPLGVAPNAHWIGVNIFTRGHAWESHIIKAFQWLMAPGGDPENAPDIVNCSWATRPEFVTDDLQWELLHNMEKAGIFVVFAAGNNAHEGPGSPAGYPHAFSVGAVTRKNDGKDIAVADFSSKGPVHWDDIKYTKPELTAPGTGIRSSWLNGGFTTLDGTSMAAAHVSGVSALLLQSRPDMNPGAIRYVLQQTAKWDSTWNQEETHPNNSYGYGIVNALAAVRYDQDLWEEEEIFKDNAGEGVVNWSTSTDHPWKITREKVQEGTFAFADSPWGEYPNNSESWMALTHPVSLNGYHSPALHFYHSYDFQTGGDGKDDYGYVELSTNGRDWSRVYRFSGANEGFEPFSVPLHLPDDSEEVFLRFRLQSNNNGKGRGWYIDNIRLSGQPQPLTELNELQLVPDRTRIGLNESLNIPAKAVFSKEYAREIEPEKVIWRSTNPSVASVHQGEITGNTAGEAVIKGEFSGKTAELHISVVEIAAPEPDPYPGTYVNSVEVHLEPMVPESAIYYTLDGSEPDRDSSQYKEEEPITLDDSTVIKTRAYLDDIPGTVSTFSYTIEEGAEVTGQIALQGRSMIDDELILFFQDEEGSRYDTLSISEDGKFATELPLGQYTLVADRKQYLSKTHDIELIKADEHIELPSLQLLAGDITNSNRVEVGDFARLSLAYRTSPGDEHWDPLADLNNDGVVNILDLRLLSQNYSLEGDKY